MYSQNQDSIISKLLSQQYKPTLHNNLPDYRKTLNKSRIDACYQRLNQCLDTLILAIDSGKWTEISNSISFLLNYILDSTSPESSTPFTYIEISPLKRQEYELFVALGGIDTLLILFNKPFCESDARSMSNLRNPKRAETWNEILAILRELCYTIPTLSTHIFTQEHIIFLFTLLSCPSIFESAVNLLEEVLSSRIDTFRSEL